MLKICKEAHEEVVYTSPICPCCMIVNHFREKLDKLQTDLQEAQEYIEVIQEEPTNAAKVESVH